MAAKWFKFYGGEYLSDPKIERLSPLERSCWLTILCMASMGNNGTIEFLTVESLLNRSGIQFDPYQPEEWEKALSVLVKFKNMKMIDTNDEGHITVKNWEKRQEHNLTPAERMAKHRRKDDNGDDNGVSLSNDNGGRAMTPYERVKKHRQNKALSENDNENVTTNVTKVTLDKNRIDKNRNKMKTLSAFSLSKPLLQPTDDDITIDSNIDENGDPIPQKQSRKKVEGKNRIALRIQHKFAEMCKKRIGIEPVSDIKSYKAALFALNTGGLAEDKIYDLFDEWFSLGKSDEESISMPRALSARQIEHYKVRNNVT